MNSLNALLYQPKSDQNHGLNCDGKQRERQLAWVLFIHYHFQNKSLLVIVTQVWYCCFRVININTVKKYSECLLAMSSQNIFNINTVELPQNMT